MAINNTRGGVGGETQLRIGCPHEQLGYSPRYVPPSLKRVWFTDHLGFEKSIHLLEKTKKGYTEFYRQTTCGS